jgi:hypothetical protein
MPLGSSSEAPVIGGAQRPHPNTLWTALDNTESRLAGRERHVVGHCWLGETLQGKRANLFGATVAPQTEYFPRADTEKLHPIRSAPTAR